MLGPFLRTPSPRTEKERVVAHAVVWVTALLSILVLLLWVVLPR